MKRKYLVWIGIVLLIIFGYQWFKSSYNKMVASNEQVEAQWAQVENVYQRRADLIPNLVNTVKGYAAHEKETLTGVIEARAKATSVQIDPSNLDANSLNAFQQAQDGLSSALGRLMVVMERYPDLKANQNFMNLQVQLEGTENRITVERRNFNEVTRSYNQYIKEFPRMFFAGAFGFEEKAYFKSAEGSDKAPEVKF